MGTADIIPGVSGGSIALITGIYPDLIEAIQSINMDVAKDIVKGHPIKGLKRINWGFLLPLLGGILTAILIMAHLMNYLLDHFELYTWSVFFGLILASAVMIGRQFKMTPARFFSLVIGIVLAFLVVGMVPVQTPDGLWFMFISGMIAICAMILPGISGAFLLLVMGKYETITGLLKSPFEGSHLLTLLVVALGCLIGIVLFSRVLKWVLANWYEGTLAFLTGMMLGSLRKIWPYKEILESQVIDGKIVTLKETAILPWHVNGNFALSLVCIFVGIVLILVLDHITMKKEK